MRIAHQRTAADHLAVLHRQQAGDGAALDLLDPGGKHPRLADIARQEQQIVHRKLLREVEDSCFVRRCHQPEFNVTGLGLDVARVGTCLTAHVDLSPNQESSFGHSRFIALAPATRLTWPPFSITSSLSVEATLGIRCLAASYGTM